MESAAAAGDTAGTVLNTPLSTTQVAALEAVAGPFESARTPPGWLFTDPAVLDLEAASLFLNDWVIAGHVSQLGSAGACLCVDTVNLHAIVVRGDDDVIRAFHNSCRHRGTRLVEASGKLGPLIRCPYHAWAYSLAGALTAIPKREATAKVDVATLGLVPLRVAVWNGFVFVCAGEPGSLDERLADFPDLSYLALDRLCLVAERHYRVACNWKLVIENYNECYHCAIAHPALHRLSRDVGFDGYRHRGRHFTGGPMSLEPGVATLAEPATRIEPGLTGWRDADRRMVFYFSVFPNLLLTIAPDYALVHYVFPASVDRCTVTTQWLVSPAQAARADCDIDPALGFWDRTNHEDFALCETAQRGLAASGQLPGPYHGWENCVHDFDRWLVQRVFSSLLSASAGTSP
ncbi:MAG: aromatic ring-hydroxylating dioxygenase subunit alpha [Pseudomonadota bacterium]